MKVSVVSCHWLFAEGLRGCDARTARGPSADIHHSAPIDRDLRCAPTFSIQHYPFRRGFSFTEILFAVMILGIGFIMVAAMFPVAIKQTELTAQETTSANMGTIGVDAIEQVAASSLLPTGLSPALQGSLPNPPLQVIHSPVWTFHDPRLPLLTTQSGVVTPAYNGTPTRDQIWQTVCGNLILSSDPRYAWVPMYRRDLILDNNTGRYFPSSMVQLTLIGVQTRNQSRYTQARDLTPLPLNDPTAEATLEGHLYNAGVRGSSPTGGPGSITFYNADGRLAEGSFAVISDDAQPYTNSAGVVYNGQYNGWIVRVGTFRPDLTANYQAPPYELVPGYDLPMQVSLGTPSAPAVVIFVGRGLTNPSLHGGGFDGIAQDISVFMTYVRVH
jgi:hypothetical protein